jgi:hypothetical protein
MDERLKTIEARLTAIEGRLSALEAAGPGVAPVPGELPGEETSNGVLHEDSVSNAATHLGRVLLIFGGAYLLRAITEQDFLPPAAGIPIGMAYAVLWLFMAWRSGVRESGRVLAMLYGGVSVLLMLPILVEAVTHFKLLSGLASVIALTVLCAASLGVAVARNLRSLAWLTTAGAIVTAGVLLRASGAVIPFAVFLLALGLASLWVTYLQGWRGLQWLGATGANLGVILLAVLSRHEHWDVDRLAPCLLGVSLWCAYLASFAIRSHRLGRPPGVFEAGEAFTASAIALGLAVVMAQVNAIYASLVGLVSLALGVGAYGLAFTPRTRDERRRSFYFCSTVGLALVIGGCALVMPPGTAAVVWALMAVGMGWFSGREGRVTMSLHCTALVIAAGVASGGLAMGIAALAGDATRSWPGVSLAQFAAAAAAVACLFIPVAQQSERWGRASGVPQLIVLALSVWIVGGLLVALAAPLIAAVPGPSADPGKLATLRTAVLAASAVTLAWSSRQPRWPEARWLAYPVLAAVGIKLVFEDFPHGRPVTLFMTLVLVGGALIVVSKFMRRGKDTPLEAADQA